MPLFAVEQMAGSLLAEPYHTTESSVPLHLVHALAAMLIRR
jgi:hypothetical protein